MDVRAQLAVAFIKGLLSCMHYPADKLQKVLQVGLRTINTPDELRAYASSFTQPEAKEIVGNKTIMDVLRKSAIPVDRDFVDSIALAAGIALVGTKVAGAPMTLGPILAPPRHPLTQILPDTMPQRFTLGPSAQVAGAPNASCRCKH